MPKPSAERGGTKVRSPLLLRYAFNPSGWISNFSTSLTMVYAPIMTGAEHRPDSGI